MDKTLIWLLIPSILVIFFILRVSARYRRKSYDLEEYLLAGRQIPPLRFILATTTISLLGILTLPHMGLFYRSGFSYGFMALGAIIVPLTGAFFARRLWILGRIFNPLTPAQLLGEYYRSNALRVLIAIIGVLVALTLTIMSLRLSASLMEGFLAEHTNSIALSEPVFGLMPLGSFVTMAIMAGLLFVHTALGGMGAVLRVAAPVGVTLLIALGLVAFVLLDATGGIVSLLDHLFKAQQNPTTSQLFATGTFFDPVPAAAPANIAWPGIMVASCLIALAGLATAPATMMTGFSATSGKSHARAHFFAVALVSGLALVTITIIIALAARLAPEFPGLSPVQAGGLSGPLAAGSEPRAIIGLLGSISLGRPYIAILLTLTLLTGLFVSTAGALLTAGAMVANDILQKKPNSDGQSTTRKMITRTVIGLLLVQAFALALQKPDDPLPLFLLAGAFGVQLLPALAGLCYFKSLSGQAIKDGMMAGLVAVIATSIIPQGLAERFALTMPFDAWPLSLHPAVWGLAANICILFVTLFIERAIRSPQARKQVLAHRRSYHVLPDEKPLMAQGVGLWKFIAWLLGAAFVGLIALPLCGLPLDDVLLGGLTLGNLTLPDFSISRFFPQMLPLLWSWQFLAWLVGLALVYVVAYKLQPTFDPEQAMQGSLDPQKRRFRVKAQTRIVEILPPEPKNK